MAVILKLMSNDGEVFNVEFNVTLQTKVLKAMLEDTGDIDDNDGPVPLAPINGATLRKGIAWCTQHQIDKSVEGEDPLDGSESRTDNIDSWDKEFLKVNQGILSELMLATNYLDIKVRQLVDAVCRFVYAES